MIALIGDFNIAYLNGPYVYVSIHQVSGHQIGIIHIFRVDCSECVQFSVHPFRIA